MDSTDTRILQVLRQEARLPVAELARRVGLARATVHERLRRMEGSGVILGATLRLDARKLGQPLRAFLLVGWRSDVHADQREVGQSIADIPGVQHVDIITGQHDFLVEVCAGDMEEVGRMIIEKIRALPGVGGTETLISFWSFEGAGMRLHPDGAGQE